MHDESTGRLVSLISLWEIAMKPKLAWEQGITTSMAESYVEQYAEWLPLRKEHILETVGLPAHHRDPFDRLLIAQSIAEDLTIMTSDRKFQQYKGLKLRLV